MILGTLLFFKKKNNSQQELSNKSVGGEQQRKGEKQVYTAGDADYDSASTGCQKQDIKANKNKNIQ